MNATKALTNTLYNFYVSHTQPLLKSSVRRCPPLYQPLVVVVISCYKMIKRSVLGACHRLGIVTNLPVYTADFDFSSLIS